MSNTHCPKCGTKAKKKWNGSRCKKCGFVNIPGRTDKTFITAREAYEKRSI